MKDIRRFGYVFLLNDRKKILQDSDFHNYAFFVYNSNLYSKFIC